MTIDKRMESGRRPADDDAWLEALLRHDAGAAPYIEDAGFADDVLAKLPPRGAGLRYRWIVPAMGLLGFIVGLVVLSGGEALSASIARLASADFLSLRSLLVAAVPLGLLWWLAVGAAWQER